MAVFAVAAGAAAARCSAALGAARSCGAAGASATSARCAGALLVALRLLAFRCFAWTRKILIN